MRIVAITRELATIFQGGAVAHRDHPALIRPARFGAEQQLAICGYRSMTIKGMAFMQRNRSHHLQRTQIDFAGAGPDLLENEQAVSLTRMDGNAMRQERRVGAAHCAGRQIHRGKDPLARGGGRINEPSAAKDHFRRGLCKGAACRQRKQAARGAGRHQELTPAESFHTASSLAYSSASHFMPWRPKLICRRASAPEPSALTMTPWPNLA